MVLGYLTKLAGLKRPVKPKVVVFTNQQTSATKNDYTDEIATSQMLRGNGSSYGFAIPRDAINSDLRLLGQPMVRLLGDEFVTASESLIWLGADKNLLVGGGPLTENNGPTYSLETSDDESPLYEQTIGNLVSSSSQYWSLPTATPVQVGANSFMVSIAFNTLTPGVAMIPVSYGSLVSGKACWLLQRQSTNLWRILLFDGTNTVSIADTVVRNDTDGRDHIIQMLVDRTNIFAYLILDGVIIASGSISGISTNTLTIAGENFYIGASKNSSAVITNFWNGSLGLCKLINNVADYNVPQVWNMGIREAVSSGTGITVSGSSARRLNNDFFNSGGTINDYLYTTINVEDGEYEIQEIYNQNTTSGISQLIIDDNLISTTDMYASSGIFNIVKKTYAVKLSGGRHTVKILTNSKNGSASSYFMTYEWINFIKRRGHENGGLTKALLLGDEINQRSNTSWTFATDTSAWYNNQMVQGSPADAQYTEGTLFIRGGVYRIDFNYYQQANTSDGKADLWIGDVQILNQFDLSAGSSGHVATTSVIVRLQQGRQNIRLASNGTGSSGHQIPMSSLRLERISD